MKLDSLGGPEAEPRARAAVQPNAILLGLYGAAQEDVVLLLDATKFRVSHCCANCGRELREPHRLAMTRHYQKLNLLAPASTCCIDRRLPFAFAADRREPPTWETAGLVWSGRSGVAAPVASFQKGLGPFALRFGATAQSVIKDAGRHLTVVDPSTVLARKLGRMFHGEWASDLGKYPQHLQRYEEHAIHHRGWWYAEQVTGTLPADLARLVDACAGMQRNMPLPPLWKRRLVRTWAWFRAWGNWPGGPVRFTDRHFEALRWLLAVPLVTLDTIRYLFAHSMPLRTSTGAPGLSEQVH